ncbi:hypothetical protein Dimus_005666, partial [Dionaea muscipula]
MSEVADVIEEEEEVPAERTVGGTQESEAVASMTKSKPKEKPKKFVGSPEVWENIMEEEEGGDEGGKAETQAATEGLLVRTRRRLRKVTFDPVPEAKDSEGTESDENVQRPAADSGVNKENQRRSVRNQGKIPIVEEGAGLVEEPDVATSGSPIFDELNREVDGILARPFIFEANPEEGNERDKGIQRDVDEDEGRAEGDMGPSASRRREKSLFAPRRLRLPLACTVRRCWDSLMGSATHITIRSMCRLLLKHKCVILCRNMAELALLMGDVIFSSVRTDGRRCRKIDKLKKEMKADVEMVMEENQTLEKKVEELEKKNKERESALEGE